MGISRRNFLSYCIASAATIGLGPFDLLKLRVALASPAGPKVVWIQGAGCSGCSISFLNRIAADAPKNAAAVFTETVDLIYHPTLIAASGSMAGAIIAQAIQGGGHILVVEGGVPTAFAGAPCWPWSNTNHAEVTFLQAVRDAAESAKIVICVGTCASFGGVSAGGGGENPGQVKPVSEIIGKPTINISGCPPHPDAIVWAIAQCVAGNTIELDDKGRPREIYGTIIHSICPRNGKSRAGDYGADSDNCCLQGLGCFGPTTGAPCPNWKWNNSTNWCVDANANCLGCTEPTFPGSRNFYNV
jgi:hydrogenase small subunit